MDVKILVMSNPKELENKICEFVDQYKCKLAGPVTVGVNQNGTTIYVATLIKEAV